KRSGKGIRFGTTDRNTAQPRTSTARSAEELTAPRIGDHPGQRTGRIGERQAERRPWQAVREVRGPVDRIEVPGQFPRTADTGLRTHDPVSGKPCADPFPDLLLDVEIGMRLRGAPGCNPVHRPQSQFLREIQVIVHQTLKPSRSLAQYST